MFDKPELVVVTLGADGEIRKGRSTIRVVPAWKFLLTPP